MMTLRKSAERGRGNHGWLESQHSFSFANYHDPAHMAFGDLVVINEDRVAGGAGFGAHSHRDMEIISYVLDGALEHQDNAGGGSVIRPGDIQRMSAGRGIQHSERNASPSAPVHFLQIWIKPGVVGIPAGYEQKAVPANGALTLLASPNGRDGSVMLHADAMLYRVTPAAGETVHMPLTPGRRAWLQVARGTASVNGLAIDQGDGVAIEGEAVHITGGMGAEILAFDLR